MVLLPLLGVLAFACSPDGDTRAPSGSPRASTSPALGEDALYEPNVVDAGKFDPVVDSPCSRALGAEIPPEGEPGVTIFFGCEGPEGPVVPAAAVSRRLREGDEGPEAALELLFDGPTDAEREAGYVSLFGPETRDLPFSFTRVDDVGVVDLSEGFGDVEFMFVSVNDVAQMASTLGGFEGVERVSILVEGEPLCRVTGDCI